jgi:hypothetical protein
LEKASFYIAELAIDEPIEDTNFTDKSSRELQELYDMQREKLPFLLANTVFRENIPKDVKIKIRFFYNPFTIEHFVITDYQNLVAPYDENTLSIMENDYFYQVENKLLLGNMGVI